MKSVKSVEPHGGIRKNAGRPKGSRNKLTAEANANLVELARAHTTEMLEILVKLARSSESDSVRATCAFGLLDRAHGKPTERIQADVQMTTLEMIVARSYNKVTPPPASE